MCLLSAQYGIRRLQPDEESAAARLWTSRAGRSALEEVMAERDQQLGVLREDVYSLMMTMSELLEEEFGTINDLADLARELKEAAKK